MLLEYVARLYGKTTFSWLIAVQRYECGCIVLFPYLSIPARFRVTSTTATVRYGIFVCLSWPKGNMLSFEC